MNLKITIKPLTLLFLFLIFLPSCTNETLSPEDKIKQYIKSGKIAAENRSYNDLADLISEQYQDHKNWDKNKIKKITRAYFFTHKNIHLFSKINSIHIQDKNKAFVVLYVAMAGTEINDLNSINPLRARIYKFELQLIKNKIWLLTQAQWKRSELKNMF